MAADTSAEDIAYVTALVREDDRPRYYATLFAPAAARSDLFALYGFAAEIARVPNLVSEPALGEIRLRWWLGALTEAVREGGGAAPALRAVAQTVSRHRLPPAPLEALVESRSADLYSDPPSTVSDLEARMGETESALFQMAAIVLGSNGPETADAAGHAGIAYGVARRLSLFASDRARARTILPADRMERSGTPAAEVFAAPASAGVKRLIADLAGLAREHLRLAEKTLKTLPRSVRPAFLPLAIAEPLLRKIENHPEVVERPHGPSDLGTLARISLARMDR